MVDDGGLVLAPVRGAPYTSRAMAHLELAVAARDVSDFARTLVPTGPRPRGVYGGVLLSDARRIAELAARVLAAAVVLEREDGTTWQEIAGTLEVTRSSAHKRWAPVVTQWQAQVAEASVSGAVAGSAVAGGEVAMLVAELDAWVVRHREHLDPVPSERPVGAALEQLDPVQELQHLAVCRRRLWAEHGEAGGAPDPAVLLPLVEREAVLEEALAAAGALEGRDQHRAAAARAWGYAAQLREAAAATSPPAQAG